MCFSIMCKFITWDILEITGIFGEGDYVQLNYNGDKSVSVAMMISFTSFRFNCD